MFKNKIVLGIIGLGIAAAIFYMLGSAPTYAELASKAREQYKIDLAKMDKSPIEEVGSQGFRYFEPKEDWIFEADFRKAESGKKFEIQLTDSTFEAISLAGYASFTKDGQKYDVMVFDEGFQYILPFKDLSNGKETYGGGRYINIGKGKLVGKKLTVDFNESHNFYCAYDENYVCPIPPVENRLNLAVTAGEKIFDKHGH